MALRCGRRVILRSPAKLSVDRRGRAMIGAPGSSASIGAPHGRGADQQRLLAAAPVQQPIGENMAAIEIGGELDFVDGDEGKRPVARHRLDRGDPIARRFGLDFLFAGDEGDGLGSDPRDDAIIDLARQKPQRQPDHAGLMREHALDRIMRLAGIGRPEHDAHAARAFERMQLRGRNGNIHRIGALPRDQGALTSRGQSRKRLRPERRK